MPRARGLSGGPSPATGRPSVSKANPAAPQAAPCDQTASNGRRTMAMSERDRALGALVRVGDQQVDPHRGAVERLRTEIGRLRCLIGHSETRAVDGHFRRSCRPGGCCSRSLRLRCPLVEGDCLRHMPDGQDRGDRLAERLHDFTAVGTPQPPPRTPVICLGFPWAVGRGPSWVRSRAVPSGSAVGRSRRTPARFCKNQPGCRSAAEVRGNPLLDPASAGRRTRSTPPGAAGDEGDDLDQLLEVPCPLHARSSQIEPTPVTRRIFTSSNW